MVGYEFIDAKYDPRKNKVEYDNRDYTIGKTKLGFFVTIKVGSKNKRFYLDRKVLPDKRSSVVLVPANKGKVGSPSHTGGTRRKKIPLAKKKSPKKTATTKRKSAPKRAATTNRKRSLKKAGCNPKSKFANDDDYECNEKTSRWNKKKYKKQRSIKKVQNKKVLEPVTRRTIYTSPQQNPPKLPRRPKFLFPDDIRRSHTKVMKLLTPPVLPNTWGVDDEIAELLKLPDTWVEDDDMYASV